MTMKYQKKNVSAENEYIIKDASFNPQTMTLTITKKNLYTGHTGGASDSADIKPIQINFNDFKPKVLKKTQNEIDALKNTQDAQQIKERETTIYLVQMNNENQDDVYKELIWSNEKQNFEQIGTTRLEIAPIQLDVTRLKEVLNLQLVTENGATSATSNRLNAIESSLNNKANSSDVPTVTGSIEDNNLNVPTSNAIYDELQNYIQQTDLASSTSNGLMSSSDKSKIDNMSYETFLVTYTDGTSEELKIYKDG